MHGGSLVRSQQEFAIQAMHLNYPMQMRPSVRQFFFSYFQRNDRIFLKYNFKRENILGKIYNAK